MKRIILTGGGTAGHVTPNIALIPRLLELGYDIQYIGSYQESKKNSSSHSASLITESLPVNCAAISVFRTLPIHSAY